MYLDVVQVPGLHYERHIPLGDLIDISKKVKQNKKHRKSDTNTEKSDTNTDTTYWVENPLLRRCSV